MAELIVEVTKVDRVEVHPNADKLDIATVKGWQCVVGRDSVKEGSLVVYVPIDAILDNTLTEIVFADSKIKPTGRIRTIKIRGQYSQGLVIPLDKISMYFKKTPYDGMDVKEILNIIKWEPEEKPTFTLKSTQGNGKAKKKDENPNFAKYTNINHMNNFRNPFLDEDEIVITEKIHGCLQANTKISLADGTAKTIKEIVDNRLDVEVLSMNFDGQLVPNKIINWFNNGLTNNWKVVKTTRNKLGKGNYYRSIVVTPNHKFFNPTTGKYIPCSNLMVGDKIMMKRNKMYIPYFQKQVLIGKMLGDGCLENNAISFRHKKDHEEYTDYTLKCLGILSGNKQKEQKSGFGSIMTIGRSISSYEIDEMIMNYFVYRPSKQINANIINQLSPISLAFWYMDDGSLSHHYKQEDRASLATCGFDEISIDLLIEAIGCLGIIATKKFTDKKYWRINFNADEANKLFTLISPYITSCMQYKLPQQYRNIFNKNMTFNNKIIYKPTLIQQEIISIEDYVNIEKINKCRYDIETEFHNFIANGILVHNSNFRAGYVPIYSYSWYKRIWKKIVSWFDKENFLHPGYEFVYGSHNVQLQEKTKKVKNIISRNAKNFGSKNVYLEAVNMYDIREQLLPGEVIYGEVYGANIQKNYDYGLKNRIDLVVFDVMKDGSYLSFKEANSIINRCNLNSVPILYIGKFKHADLKKYLTGPSELCPLQKVREGFVIKMIVEPKEQRRIYKYINPEYAANKNNTDWH